MTITGRPRLTIYDSKPPILINVWNLLAIQTADIQAPNIWSWKCVVFELFARGEIVIDATDSRNQVFL